LEQTESPSDVAAPTMMRSLEMWFLEKENAALTWGFWKPIVWAIVSIALSLLVSAVIMILSGYDPILAYTWLLYGILRQPDYVLYFATPLILTGLSVALAFKCGLFNIGAEGQVYLGSMAAAIIGYAIALPIFVHPLVCLAVGAGAGALWGFVPGLLKAYRGAHEVVTTMMLSYTAILFTQWLSTYPLREPGQVQMVPQLPQILSSAMIPKILGSHYLHLGIVLAIASVFVVDFIIKRTVLGYEMRAVGLNRDAAECAGIDPRRNMAIALGLSGALAGLAGSEEILGTYGRFIDHWSPSIGFDGITVAVLGRNHPWGCLLAAVFFGALRAGGTFMNLVARVPIEMVGVIQGLIVLFVAAPRINDWLAKNGVGYPIWIKNNPKVALPNFAALCLAAWSAVLAFGFCAVKGISTTLYVLFLVTAFLGIVAFVTTLSRRGHVLVLNSAIVALWLAIGVLDRLQFGGGTFITSVMVACVGLVISASLAWFSRRETKERRSKS